MSDKKHTSTPGDQICYIAILTKYENCDDNGDLEHAVSNVLDDFHGCIHNLTKNDLNKYQFNIRIISQRTSKEF